MKISAAIVVYNKEISESITYKNIKKINSFINVLVLDNSEKKNNNDKYCKENEIRFISMNGNAGLSKAYNAAIDKSMDSDVIILLDDDTEITSEYFEKLRNALEKHPEVDIFAPVIRGQDGVIYSPNEFNFLRNHLISTPDQEVSQKHFNAIASCLAIRMRVFDDYRFNEKLFVDQVDQFFFCEQRNRGKKFGKLDVEIKQNFYQRGATLSSETGWRRLKMRIFDIFRHARLMGGGKYIPLAFIKCCGLGVQVGKKSKSIPLMFKAAGLSIKLLFVEK